VVEKSKENLIAASFGFFSGKPAKHLDVALKLHFITTLYFLHCHYAEIFMLHYKCCFINERQCI